MTFRWLTTNPNPRTPATGVDAGQRGWRLHAIEASAETTLFEARGLRAACGLRPRHGWGLDMFINDHCKRCERALAKDR